MSKLTKNGKNLILENTIVSYSPKDDTIHITSADPDLYGEPFHISLNQSSQTENTLRKLLIEQGIIKEDLIGSNLPDQLSMPESLNQDPMVFDIGVSRHGTVSWNPVKDSHLGIYGYTGSGKTVVVNNILLQALNNQDVWDIYCFDPKRVEYSHIKEKLNNPDNYMDSLAASTAILRNLYFSMLEKLDMIENSRSLINAETNKNKPSLIFIDSLPSFSVPRLSESEEETEHNEEFNRYLKELLYYGRAAEIYIVFTSQIIDMLRYSNIKMSIPSTILMGKSSEAISKSTLNSNIAVRTPQIKGRGHFKFGNTEPTQFQAYATLYSLRRI